MAVLRTADHPRCTLGLAARTLALLKSDQYTRSTAVGIGKSWWIWEILDKYGPTRVVRYYSEGAAAAGAAFSPPLPPLFFQPSKKRGGAAARATRARVRRAQKNPPALHSYYLYGILPYKLAPYIHSLPTNWRCSNARTLLLILKNY
jgi:hypothetical protein